MVGSDSLSLLYYPETDMSIIRTEISPTNRPNNMDAYSTELPSLDVRTRALSDVWDTSNTKTNSEECQAGEAVEKAETGIESSPITKAIQ